MVLHAGFIPEYSLIQQTTKKSMFHLKLSGYLYFFFVTKLILEILQDSHGWDQASWRMPLPPVQSPFEKYPFAWYKG
jgi:hypothetical protein